MRSSVSGVFLGYRPNIWKDGTAHGFSVSLQDPNYQTQVLSFPTVNDFDEKLLQELAPYSPVEFSGFVNSDRKTPWLFRVVLDSITLSKAGRHAN